VRQNSRQVLANHRSSAGSQWTAFVGLIFGWQLIVYVELVFFVVMQSFLDSCLWFMFFCFLEVYQRVLQHTW
jgi:hypothetical protein